MKKHSKFLVILLVISMILPGIVQAAPTIESTSIERLSGSSRIKTAIAVSQEVYPDGSAKNVVLAGYNGEVDALTGTLLAAAKDGPLLLVNNYNDIKDELKRLGAKNIYLLGGTSVIKKSVETSLINDDYKVKRVSGSERFGTAAKVAQLAVGESTHVFLTNDGRSGSLADALAAGPVSGRYQEPILLTSKNKLPKTTLNALEELGARDITIVGGTGVVTNNIKKTLENKGYTVNRIYGNNRWETAISIADKYFKSSDKAIVANDGRNGSFADALVGGYLGAKNNAPIILTSADKINNYTLGYLNNDVIKNTIVLGGTSVVQENILQTINKVLNTDNTLYFDFDNFTGRINGLTRAGREYFDSELVIPSRIDGEKVTTIANDAFYGNNLTSVYIPIGITSIGSYAFYSNKLTSLTIPDGIRTVGDYAFGRNKLTRITVPDNVAIGEYLLDILDNRFRNGYNIYGEGTYVGTQDGAWRKNADKSNKSLYEILANCFPLLGKTEGFIINKFGRPIRKDTFKTIYYDYGKFLVFFDIDKHRNPDKVSSIWLDDLAGIANSEEYIVRRFGKPIERFIDEEDGSYNIKYYVDEYSIYFIDVGKSYASIMIKKSYNY